MWPGNRVTDAQFVDPLVSKRKFEREIEEYRSLESQHLKKGWLLIRAEFPHSDNHEGRDRAWRRHDSTERNGSGI